MLTKKQAWEKIAEKYERAEFAGTDVGVHELGGLCWQVDRLMLDREIDDAMWRAMKDDLSAVADETPLDSFEGYELGDECGPSWFWWPRDLEHAGLRAMLAQSLAEVAE